MEKILDYLRDYNFVSITVRLVLAMIVGGIIGLERGKQGRAAGMRTHILVCIGSALVSLIGFFSTSVLGSGGDPLRIAAQVVSGIGFLGVGTILIKGRFQITGLTTAAGLWTSAAIGLALGAGFYEGAIVTTVLAIATITVVHFLEYRINKKYSRFGIYVEIRSDKDVRRAIDFMKASFRVGDIQVTAPRSSVPGNVGIEANIFNDDFSTSPDKVSEALEAEEWAIFALESL
ncbi:MAG: MgtC/SapB family protein [Clostridia bacterium]|nr:MgtC/SapB family protein [Clostridia bacterium]